MSDVEAISVNRRAAELTAALSRDAALLNLGVVHGPLGETLIDAGAKQRGGLEAGLRIAEICMGGLGAVRLAPDNATPRWPWTIAVSSPQPVIACLGSQYAGWSLAHGTGKAAFFALGSGPARALAQKEAVFQTHGPNRALRYNGYPGAEINGGPAAGFSSGQAEATIAKLAR